MIDLVASYVHNICYSCTKIVENLKLVEKLQHESSKLQTKIMLSIFLTDIVQILSAKETVNILDTLTYY